MFNGEAYKTKGYHEEIPVQLKIVVQNCVTELVNSGGDLDRILVFNFSVENDRQKLFLSQNDPQKDAFYDLGTETEVGCGLIETIVYVVDDGDYCTFLLGEEY